MDYELKIRQLEENIDRRLDRITQLQEQNTIAIRENAAAIQETQAGMRDLETIVTTLAKTTDELVRALTAAGRTNGKP